MKSRNSIFFTVILVFCIVQVTSLSEYLVSGTNPNDKSAFDNSTRKDSGALRYAELWQETQHLISKGLIKSALKTVDLILKKAEGEGNSGQMLKGLFYRFNYLQRVEEKSLVKIQQELTDRIRVSKAPVRQLLHSISAEMYWNYYRRNRYRFLSRSKTSQFKQADMQTWDLKKIVSEVVSHYKHSLTDDQVLKNTGCNIIDPVLERGNRFRRLRPTLYDFLAHRAIDFFSNNEANLTKAVDHFRIDSSKYFLDNDQFIGFKLKSSDPLSFHYHAIRYLQDLMRFHSRDTDPSAYLDVDFKRLKFVYDKGAFEDRVRPYLKALDRIINRYDRKEIIAEAKYWTARFYSTLANRYKPTLSEEYRWHKKKAYRLCQEIIKIYPGTYGARNARNLMANIRKIKLELTLEQITIPDKPFRALLAYQNVDRVYFRLVETNREELKQYRYKNRQKIVNHFLSRPVLKSWQQRLPDEGDFQAHSAEVRINPLHAGHYLVLVSGDPEFNSQKSLVSFSFFKSTKIAYTYRTKNNSGMELFLVNRSTSAPLRNIAVQVWYRNYNRFFRKYQFDKGKLFQSDKNGYLNLSRDIYRNRNLYLEFIDGDDRHFPDRAFHSYGPYAWHRIRNRVFFFTDRAIYRPGQYLYFKGIAVRVDNKDGEKTSILPNYPCTVRFYDVNGQKIAEKSLVSNEFGTFHGSFKIPLGLLNGNMRLQFGTDTHYFSVEEYKRPKFKVQLKRSKKAYRVGDKAEISGMASAFSGYPIDGAKVRYRVLRELYYPYPWYYRGRRQTNNSIEIKQGTTRSDQKGVFKIRFIAAPDPYRKASNHLAYRYTVHADVTDINGETRSASRTYYIGYTALKLNIRLSSHLDRSKGNQVLTISGSDLSGDPVKAAGTIRVYRIKSPKKILRKRLWHQPDQFLIDRETYDRLFPNDVYRDEDIQQKWPKERKMQERAFDTGKTKRYQLAGLREWPCGRYLVELSSFDRYGNKIKGQKYFTLFDLNEKQMPVRSLDWFHVKKRSLEPGETAKMLIGSSDDKVRVIFETEYRGTIVKRQFIHLNNEQKIIRIPILEKHRGNLNLSLFFIKHNRVFRHNTTLFVPWTNKKLDIAFESFRDKLMPGEKEQWKIKIRGKDGDHFLSEFAATLYDASLDQFRLNSWGIGLFPQHYFRNHWHQSNDYSLVRSRQTGKYRDSVSGYSKRYDRLNFQGFYLRGYHYYRSKNGKRRSKFDTAAPMVAMEKSAPVAKKEAPAPKKGRDSFDGAVIGSTVGDAVDAPGRTEQEESKKTNGKNLKSKPDLSTVKARSNLIETAFFYPQLRTNATGEVVISFTIPEALTKWKMLGFAHTKDLKYGFVQKELQTRKQLMVVPNPPRFFRESDRIEFSSKVTNLSESDLTGEIQLFLLDAVTLKPVDQQFRLAGARQAVQLKKGQSRLVTWQLQIPDDIDSVTCRVVARAGNYSDGEETVIPILNNRMLVTESLPLPVKPLETRTFKFHKLLNSSASSSLKHHKLTLEFTANPAWYAVQALPYMMEYPHECLEQTFSRFYANSIAGHIVNSMPAIKRVFNAWAKTKDSNALLSKLEKNQELKSLLLEETPWVMEGKSESQRKKRIALLFDLNRMGDELGRALRKLEEGQMASGAWPWFTGMRENRYITQHIVSGFAHLNVLKVLKGTQKKRVDRMAARAIRWLDEQIKRDYDYLVEHKRDLNRNHLSYIQIHYLYARSYYRDLKFYSGTEMAFEYYKQQGKKFWLDYNRYMQGMIALFLNRYGKKDTAESILKSIREHAIHSDEMGIYWKESYGYNWYRAPVERHALLIEAFAEVLKDRETVTGLKTWLLKSKQTQDWKTTKATAEACYALLLHGDNWLKENRLPEITLGEIKVEPLKMDDVKVEAGTGYFKTAWSGSDIDPGMGTVMVKNRNDVVAWGALYWQYFEDLDKITAAKTPLAIEKELFIERYRKSGPVLIPFNKAVPKIGDRIKVRIELRVDRDMSYVHMKDMRASGFEPENVISRYKWQDGLGYYESTKDGATHFFMDYLRKGTYVFEYPMRITHNGQFSNGITTIQCMYAPEFTSHSKGIRVAVK